MGEDEVAAIVRAASPNIGFYAGTIALAIVPAVVAACGYLAVAVVLVLRARGDEPGSPAAGATRDST